MTCHSSDSAETIENERGSETESGVVDSDHNRIAAAVRDLKKTGWYWGRLTANEAKRILQNTPEGTFLLRDSSQRDYLFTISAVTSAGPTNLRIEYRDGQFKLDSVLLMNPQLKRFDSVVHLVEHYVLLSRTLGRGAAAAAKPSPSPSPAPPPSSSPAPPNGAVRLLMTTPVYAAVPSLQHLCRVSINRASARVRDLPLPGRLRDYLTDYAYHV
ncbi:suppressor of cytokine signaling 2-like [Anguilla rostrata]|uniref:suppressor of cytokine signaling 2-like n=1 Tax=Anguilla rostrata TaxID=7938 RepID=UPI0030D50E31